ncbi:hypothetical protein A2U01_0052400, partial [Trifolium medium]|nr:hypothetical protein [Trifolium medium]
MAIEANVADEMVFETITTENGKVLPKMQRLDCIYDDEPLSFEKDPSNSNQKMQSQDPLQEIDIGDGSIKRPTFISLSRDLVEHRLPLLPDKKPVKQLPR